MAKSLVSWTAGECSPAGVRDATQPSGVSRMPSWVSSTSGSLASAAFGGIDFDTAKLAGGVEQRELVGDLADAEAEMNFVGEGVLAAAGADAKRSGEVVEVGRAVAVGPPETRMRDVELRCVAGCEGDGAGAGRDGDWF